MAFTVGFDSGTLIVEGPADVEVVEGQCDVLGFPLAGPVHVDEFRALPITPKGRCVVGVVGGVVRHVNELTIPSGWSSLSLEGIVMIVGDVDSGKTTLSTYLLNTHVVKGLHVCVVDADVGQSSIGPPGVIGAGCTSFPTHSLSALHMMSGYFLGCTSPSQCVGRFIGGLLHVVRDVMSRTPGLVIIDMPGWVSDGGVEFIRDAAEAVGADYVVSLSLGMRAWPGTRVIEVERSRYVRQRSPSERRMLRVASLRQYLSNLVEVEVSLDKVFGNSIIECLAGNCGRYVVEEGLDNVVRHGNVVKVPTRQISNVFCGLLRRGFLVGFGILRDFDFKRRVAKALVTTDNFDGIYVGRMRVDPDRVEELDPLPFI